MPYLPAKMGGFSPGHFHQFIHDNPEDDSFAWSLLFSIA
jgi:hypothetical protein